MLFCKMSFTNCCVSSSAKCTEIGSTGGRREVGLEWDRPGHTSLFRSAQCSFICWKYERPIGQCSNTRLGSFFLGCVFLEKFQDRWHVVFNIYLYRNRRLGITYYTNKIRVECYFSSYVLIYWDKIVKSSD